MLESKEVKIKSALEQLMIQNNILSESSFEDLFDGFDDDDSDSSGFLTSIQQKIIESLCRLPSHRWDSKKLCKGYLILEEYKEELLSASIDFIEIEKPDFTHYELSKNSNLIKIGINNTIILNRSVCTNFENKLPYKAKFFPKR